MGGRGEDLRQLQLLHRLASFFRVSQHYLIPHPLVASAKMISKTW